MKTELKLVKMSAMYMVKKNGVESGPYTQEQVLALVDGGNIASSDLICFARKWRWLGRDHWFSVAWLRHPPGLRDIRIPRSTLIVWTCIAASGLALLVIYLLQK